MLVSLVEKARDPDVARVLEDALARVRCGETTGILLLEQDVSGCSYACAGLKDRWTIIGFLSHAMFKLNSE